MPSLTRIGRSERDGIGELLRDFALRSACILFGLLQFTLTRFLSPDHAQGMEYESVANCQLARVRDNLTGVIDTRIERATPALMSDDPPAVPACRLLIVAIAVIPDRTDIFGH